MAGSWQDHDKCMARAHKSMVITWQPRGKNAAITFQERGDNDVSNTWQERFHDVAPNAEIGSYTRDNHGMTITSQHRGNLVALAWQTWCFNIVAISTLRLY